MKKILTAAAAALVLTGCAPALASLSPEQLGLSARDAQLEARTAALTWDSGARLRWIEGGGIGPSGLALPEGGAWRFHYTAPGRTAGLAVVVGFAGMTSEEGSPASPPGVALGQAELTGTWVDSPEVLRAALAARGGTAPARATLVLVPGQPSHWIVTFPDADARRWRVHAGTGEVLGT